MEKMTKISGKVIPIPMNNIDTDLIIPAQYLTSVSNSGYGENVFRRLRDSDPDFAFNQAKYSDANILVTQDNFGCGSSREHAVWALMGAGIKVIIAESFADIFYSNSVKNGLVLITQPASIIKHIMTSAIHNPYFLEIDMISQVISDETYQHYNFILNPFDHYCFTNGLDQLDYLMEHNHVK